MAMYETLGYCPDNSFSYFMNKGKYSPTAEIVMDILGDRTGYMVYDKSQYAYGHRNPSIVEVLLGGKEGDLGVEVANYLENLIPKCEYGVTGKKIQIEDVVTPYAMDIDICHHERYDKPLAEWCFFKNGWSNPKDPVIVKDGKVILYDKRFVVYIKEKDEETVIIKIFRHPNP